MSDAPAKIVIDKISNASGADDGLRVRIHATLESGEAAHIDMPYKLVPSALQALLAADEAARVDRRKAGIVRTDDAGFAMDIEACHIATTSRPDHIGLGFRMKSGGIMGFAIPKKDVLRMAELLKKTAEG